MVRNHDHAEAKWDSKYAEGGGGETRFDPSLVKPLFIASTPFYINLYLCVNINLKNNKN